MLFKIDQYLIPILTNAKSRLLLQQQLQKDFSKVQEDFPADFRQRLYEIPDLYQLIKEKVTLFLEQGQGETLQLLYTIDIPEKEFLDCIQQADFLDEIVRLIIQREAQKIHFRIKYS